MESFDAIEDQAEYERAVAEYDEDHQRIDVGPTKQQRLGAFTVVSLILNRTIGSGIFIAPSKVLTGTGSIGASLILWASGGLLTTAGLLCWLELGLSLPLHRVPGSGVLKSVPRSGGEKNFLEYIFQRPKFMATCVYGIAFVLLGNLSGNAIAFGQYLFLAAGKQDPSKGAVCGVAVGALTLCSSLHIFSRRGGIIINDVFACLKVAILMLIIVLGFIKAGGGLNHMGDPSADKSNFSPKTAFKTDAHDTGSYIQAGLYVFYSYSGWTQPFYILSEVATPRKIFPKYTLVTMLMTTLLFVLVNVSFFCVVPKEVQLEYSNVDMATLFFMRTFGSKAAQKVMAAFTAISIFGNILVMTFTAARVKQEIAKEGILPFSLFFATGHTSPWAWLKLRWRSRDTKLKADMLDNHAEQTPIAALGLHWLTSVFLIAITSMLKSGTAYSFLVSLYSYVIVILMGFLTSGGLLYLKFDKSKNWNELRNFRPWLDPLPALVYFITTGFFMFASFAKPRFDSPFSYQKSHLQWYLIPAIGLSAVFWGLTWWGGLRLEMLRRRKELVVSRLPFIVPDADDPGQWIQRSEVVDHEWRAHF